MVYKGYGARANLNRHAADGAVLFQFCIERVADACFEIRAEEELEKYLLTVNGGLTCAVS